MGIEKLSTVRRPKILIVEDKVEITKIYEGYLEDKDFDVHITNSAQQAWLELEREIFDLIITDLHMPHLDGEQFSEVIRINHKDVPIIIASGMYNKIHENQVEREPNLTLLQKPFNEEAFLNTIDQTLK